MWRVHFIILLIEGYLLYTRAVRHSRNLVWAMSPVSRVGPSRIVGIEGDPEEWIPSGNVTVRHISAPHIGWQFRGLAFHFQSQTLYWSERSNKRVQGLVLNGSTSTISVYSGSSNEVDGVVVDWISNNLYFADPKYNWIMMVPLNKTDVYKKVIDTGLDKPHGLAVYPQKGYLFWSDWGYVPKIEMADLLGQNRRILVNHDVIRPRGIAVDFDDNKLYWVDSGKDTVERIEFNGNNRRTLARIPSTNFFSVALFKKYIFVTEQEEGHLRIFDKVTGTGYINYQLGNVPYGIIMYDEDMQLGDTSGCGDFGCEQICVDKPLVGPKCLCGEGYEIKEDQKTCLDTQDFLQPAHIYAIGDAICQYPANVADMSLVNKTLDSQCFLKTRKGFTALTFDGRNKILYYTENVTSSIGRVQLRKGAFTDTVIRGVGEIRGIALDWTTSTLYWTDSEYKHIMVAKSDGRYQKTLIDTDLVEPLGIAVHPQRGELYWTDPARSVIEMSFMNGYQRKTLNVDSGSVKRPNHLYIDIRKDKLYWADSDLHQISSFDLNSRRYKVEFRLQSASFFGISVFNDYLIWTDTDKMNGIHVADMTTGVKQRGILHPQVGVSADVITYDINNQPSPNAVCENSLCEQLCLPSSNISYMCACGTGFELSDDKTTCTSERLKNNFLVVTDAYQRQLFQVGIDDGSVHAIPMSQHYRPIAIDYDAMMENLYWTDNQAKFIKGGHIGGKEEFTVKVLQKRSVVDGIAVDYINHLLYFTDTGMNTITVTSLGRNTYSKTIISEDLDEPRDIVVHPLDGRMFWTDWGDDPKIEAADMDGADRSVLVNLTAKSWPNGLALDYNERKIYWVDAKYDKVETIDLNGRGRKVLYEDPKSHYFGITLLQDYLYVTDWTKNYVSRLRKTGEGSMERVGPAKFSRLNGIIAYNWDAMIEGRSPCYDTNCDQLCLPKRMFTFVCACADNYTLSGNKCLSKGGTPNIVTTVKYPTPKPKTVSEEVDINDMTTISDTLSIADVAVTSPPGLQSGTIAAIAVVCILVTIVATIASVYLYKRYRNQLIRHDRLVEDSQVDSFYRITFPDNKDEPHVDTGIENPSYNQLNKR